MKSHHPRAFEIGDDVLVTNYRGEGRWLPGIVVEIKGSTNYEVQLVDGRVVHRHVDQIVGYQRPAGQNRSYDDVFVPNDVMQDVLPQQLPLGDQQPTSVSHEQQAASKIPVVQEVTETIVSTETPSNTTTSQPVDVTQSDVMGTRAPEPTIQRRAPSARMRRRPAYLEDYEP